MKRIIEIPKTVIAISGKQGSGKTTLATNLMLNFSGSAEIIKFAQPIYDIANYAEFRLKDQFGYDLTKDHLARLMQIVGTEWGREVVDPDIWVKIALNRIKSSTQNLIIVDDARFENEVNALKSLPYKVHIIRLDAPEQVRKQRAEKWRDATDHPSEVGLDHYKFDVIYRTDVTDQVELLKDVLRLFDEEYL